QRPVRVLLHDGEPVRLRPRDEGLVVRGGGRLRGQELRRGERLTVERAPRVGALLDERVQALRVTQGQRDREIERRGRGDQAHEGRGRLRRDREARQLLGTAGGTARRRVHARGGDERALEVEGEVRVARVARAREAGAVPARGARTEIREARQ